MCELCFTTDGPFGDGRSKGDLSRLPVGMKYSACPYYEQVYSAMMTRKVVMNFSSFLFQTTMTKRFDEPRDLLICDEGHQLEPQLLDFVSFSINDSHLQKQGLFIPDLCTPYDYYLWFNEVKVVQLIAEAIKKANAKEDPHLVDELSRLLKKYQLFVKRVERAGDKRNTEWVSEYEEKKNKSGEITHRSITIKPVFVHGFAEELLFQYADRVLIMSATILDVNIICKSLGIQKSEVASKRVRNRFPVANRPIYLRTVAKMTGGKEAMHKWAPAVVAGVNEIMRLHVGEKGIIHTHNFAIMEHLLMRCDSDVQSRFLNQRDFLNKTKMLAEHAIREDSVIVAPAMHEGIDLVDSLSRFQILCKIPFANCYDNKQLARRVEIDRRYYLWLTAIKLCQSAGRSVRSETDYAVTYILDESIYRFLDDTKSMLPTWFTEAIQEWSLNH
jgi:Rad3-related DNA helicase